MGLGPVRRTFVIQEYFWIKKITVFVFRAAQGKNDVDNKAVENAVCILRNLSYRLESEVNVDKHARAEIPLGIVV